MNLFLIYMSLLKLSPGASAFFINKSATPPPQTKPYATRLVGRFKNVVCSEP